MNTTVWKCEIESNGYKRVREVKVYTTLLDEVINVSVGGYTIGPRGGYSAGNPGFSPAEWFEVVKAVEARMTDATTLATSAPPLPEHVGPPIDVDAVEVDLPPCGCGPDEVRS
jgi:hypothetical protein